MQCVSYKSMDLTQQSLQSNKLMESFFQISESFFELTSIFKIMVELGLCM